MLPGRCDGVSPTWLHPDLRRQRVERERNAELQRVTALEQRAAWLHDEEQLLSAAVSAQRQRYEQLAAAAAAAQRVLDTTEQLRGVVHTLHEQASNQVHYHKNMLGAPAMLAASSPSPPAMVQASSGASLPSPPTPSQVAAMLRGDHNDNDDNDDAQHTATSSSCGVELLLLPTLLCRVTAVGRSDAGNGDAAVARRFLRLYAPLFDYDAPRRCVMPPFFFDEPCLVEGRGTAVDDRVTEYNNDDENNSSNNDDGDALVCSSDGCAYWHRDQPRHMRRVLARLLCRLRAHCVRDERVCVVAHVVATLARCVRCAATSLEQLCGAAASTLSTIIALGWHVHMLALAPKSGGVWPAPVLAITGYTTDALHCITNDSNDNNNNAPSSSYAAADAVTALLRDAHECAAWRAVVTRARAARLSLAAAASEAFQQQSPSGAGDAVAWRVLLRVTASTPAQRRWAAARGVALYPNSPHAHVHHILECATAAAAAAATTPHAQDEARACVQQCLRAAHVLSAQVAAATILASATTTTATTTTTAVHDMSSSTAYAAMTMRCIAYMLARCAVTLASVDVHAAVALLTRAVDDGVGGALTLLPLALANLAMLLMTMRQAAAAAHDNDDTNNSDRRTVTTDWQALPLGAVSDMSFVLRNVTLSSTTVRPHELCGRQLNALLELVAACERDHHHNCNSATATSSRVAVLPPLQRVKAATQLSLMRVYAPAGTRYVEQILTKLSLSSDIAQAVLWCEYVRCVAESDDVAASLQLTEALLQPSQHSADSVTQSSSDCTSALSCVLTLLCVWQLDVYARPTTAHVSRCCRCVLQRLLDHDADDDKYSDKRSDSVPAMDVNVRVVTPRLLACLPAGLPAMERAALCVLLSRLLSSTPPSHDDNNDDDEEHSAADASTLRERWQWLHALPHDVVTADDADAVVLLLVAEAQVAAALRDVALFVRSVERHVRLLRELHLLWWSALDVWYSDVVGVPHAVLLFVYQLVPSLLGAEAAVATAQWREALLRCAARLNVLPPLLRDDDDDDDDACVAL